MAGRVLRGLSVVFVICRWLCLGVVWDQEKAGTSPTCLTEVLDGQLVGAAHADDDL